MARDSRQTEPGRRGGGRSARRASRANSSSTGAVRPGQAGGFYKPLSDRDIERIHGAALDVLENIGIGEPIEEVLRYDAPVQLVLRRATERVEIAGAEIPGGATVVLLLGSANRDEVQFPSPDVLDTGRDTRGHLGFGFGTHYCLGAGLARLEARLALEAFFSRHVRVVPGAGPVERVPSMLVRGPRRLAVSFEVRSRGARSASAA